MKLAFQIVGVLGFIIICICAFVIPNDPYEIIPVMTIMGFDKPLWFAIIFGGGFMYLLILLGIYDKVVGLDYED